MTKKTIEQLQTEITLLQEAKKEVVLRCELCDMEFRGFGKQAQNNLIGHQQSRFHRKVVEDKASNKPKSGMRNGLFVPDTEWYDNMMSEREQQKIKVEGSGGSWFDMWSVPLGHVSQRHSCSSPVHETLCGQNKKNYGDHVHFEGKEYTPECFILWKEQE